MTATSVHLLGYHPTNLCYRLVPDAAFKGEHPRGGRHVAHEKATGVHGIWPLVDWEHNLTGTTSGVLMCHDITTGERHAARAEFAALPEATRRRHAQVGPAGMRGRWAVGLGLSLAAVTVDGYVVVRPVLQTGRCGSLVRGTLEPEDLRADGEALTISVLRRLLYHANVSLSRDVVDLHPTHLAMSAVDGRLWLGGWMSLALTVDQVPRVLGYPTVAFPIEQAATVALTDSALYDLGAMRVHRSGGELLERTWLP